MTPAPTLSASPATATTVSVSVPASASATAPMDGVERTTAAPAAAPAAVREEDKVAVAMSLGKGVLKDELLASVQLMAPPKPIVIEYKDNGGRGGTGTGRALDSASAST